jgi:hypothetical protein
MPGCRCGVRSVQICSRRFSVQRYILSLRFFSNGRLRGRLFATSAGFAEALTGTLFAFPRRFKCTPEDIGLVGFWFTCEERMGFSPETTSETESNVFIIKVSTEDPRISVGLLSAACCVRFSSIRVLYACWRRKGGLFLGAAMIQRIPQISFRSAAATRLQRVSKGRECT